MTKRTKRPDVPKRPERKSDPKPVSDRPEKKQLFGELEDGSGMWARGTVDESQWMRLAVEYCKSSGQHVPKFDLARLKCGKGRFVPRRSGGVVLHIVPNVQRGQGIVDVTIYQW